MTDDKDARGVKYIHSLTWDLDGCKNDCPKCAYDNGWKAASTANKLPIKVVVNLPRNVVNDAQNRALQNSCDEDEQDLKDE